ncbi:chloride channel protein CLC-f-like [Arachis duranensis]|uniref:Chloride channel protein CLC-f-like n=1 Tax=Arachis duranensis TaxID=130453 RepID=A0A9C6TWL8_ARADU|nr:chloride channel protein CLC-f-like [Arachis duranensis]
MFGIFLHAHFLIGCFPGAVGLAIWVPSVTNRKKEIDNKSDTRNSPKGYSPVSPADENEDNWRQANAADGLELSVVSDAADHEAIDKKLHLKNLKVSQAMSDSYLKVSSSATLKDAIQCIHDGYQNCVLVVNQEGFLEGILTYGDIRRCLPEKSSDTSMRDSGFVDVCRKCFCSLYI